MIKTINIVGRGQGKLDGLNDPAEKWTCNYYLPGVDIMFDMHKAWDFPGQDEQHAITRANGCRLMGLDDYPISEIQNRFKTEFFSNVICYMIAYALYLDYDRLQLWGCAIEPAADDGSIIRNHPGVEYWVGYAQGMGKDVKVYGNSLILQLKKGRYGYDRD
jgi:hypothetical protein